VGKTVRTQNGVDIIIDFPKKDLTVAQKDQVKARLDTMEQAFADHRGDAWKNLFDEQVDLATAVDFFISQELSRNVDGYRLSSPFYIPIGGRIHFGPIWDFNLGYGNADYENGWRTDGWRAQEWGVWFGHFLQHPAFCSALRDRWLDLRGPLGSLSNKTIFGVIDRHEAVMGKEAIAENFRIWGGLGEYLWPNAYWFDTYDNEKLALKSWVALRADWIDQEVKQRDCSALQGLDTDLTEGGSITVSDSNSPAAEQPTQAFDNNVFTKWLVFAPSATLTYAFADGAAHPVTSYTIYAANDVPERDPSSWVFEGSHDGRQWIPLDERHDENFERRFQGRTFPISNVESFEQYRFRFLSNHGAWELQLSEIQLSASGSAGQRW
jgi:hypothetical protein